MAGEAPIERLRSRMRGALADLDQIEAEHARAMEATGNEALIYWHRRAIRAEGERRKFLRDKGMTDAAVRLVEAAVDVGEWRRAGPTATMSPRQVKRHKTKTANRVWNDFNRALDEYLGEQPEEGTAAFEVGDGAESDRLVEVFSDGRIEDFGDGIHRIVHDDEADGGR